MAVPAYPREERALSAELAAILGMGVAVGVPLWAALCDLRREINALRTDVAQACGSSHNRMARLEGLVDAASAGDSARTRSLAHSP